MLVERVFVGRSQANQLSSSVLRKDLPLPTLSGIRQSREPEALDNILKASSSPAYTVSECRYNYPSGVRGWGLGAMKGWLVRQMPSSWQDHTLSILVDRSYRGIVLLLEERIGRKSLRS